MTASPNLYKLESVLVSTGWNKNEDVLLPSEVWPARDTAEDKPFNYEHVEDDIIGHITACRTVDKSFAPMSDIPRPHEDFHVIVGSVLYRHWEKKELSERMETLLKEIAEGKWFVSMECFFKSFDYLLEDKQTGASRVIARTEKTAFLTRHLRAYGGNGVYQQYRVGRLLRGVVFSGKGLVRNPANPNSIILDHTAASITYGAAKGKQMSDELTALRAENEKLKASLADRDAEGMKKALEKAQAELAESKKAYESLKKDAESHLKALESAKTLAETSVALAKERDELKAKLAQIEADKATTERISKAMKDLEMDAASAAKFVEGLKGVSDEAFSSHIEVLALTIKARQTVTPVSPNPAALAAVTPVTPAAIVTTPNPVEAANELAREVANFLLPVKQK